MSVAFITDEYAPTIIGGTGIYTIYLTAEISNSSCYEVYI